MVVAGDGLRLTCICDAAYALQPLGEIDLVGMDFLAACLSHLVRHGEQSRIRAAADRPSQKDTALLERLAHGGEPVRFAVFVLGEGSGQLVLME